MFSLETLKLIAFAAVLRLLFLPRLRLPAVLRYAIAGAIFALTAVHYLAVSPTWTMLGTWLATACLASAVIPAEHFDPVAAALGRWRFGVFLASIAMVTWLVFVYLPILNYLSSPGELGLDIPHLVKYGGRDAMSVVLASALIYPTLYFTRLKNLVSIAAVGAAALALVYAFAMPFGYPRLSGLVFEQRSVADGTGAWRTIVDIGIAAIVATTVMQVLRRIAGHRLFTILTAVHLAIILAVSVTAFTAEDDRGSATSIRHSERPFRFSRAHPNVLVIFLDRFMGGFVERILEDEPDLKHRLAGFTWYPRTVSAGPYTITGVHALFGGYDYLPHEMNKRDQRLLELSVEAYQILPRNFSKAGYEVHFTNPRGLGFTMAGDCNFLQLPGVHCQHIAPSVVESLAAKMKIPVMLHAYPKELYRDLLLLLSTMRASPYFARHHVYHSQEWQPFTHHSAGTTFREWAQLKALPELTALDNSSSHFSIMWSILPHEPDFMGEDCLPKKDFVDFSKEEIRQRNRSSAKELAHAIAARCSLLLVADYLDWMKAQGVYDNTKIAIVSDHGVHGIEDRSSRAVQGGTTAAQYARTRALFMLKPEGAQGLLSTSETFVPGAEMPRILCEQIGGCVNPFLDDRTIESHGRDDPFYLMDAGWRFTEQNRKSFRVKEEWILRGKDPYRRAGWTESQ